jgi:hypothetical protein
MAAVAGVGSPLGVWSHDVNGEHAVPFDAAKHLSRVNGGDYLELKWRLVWLRDRHPDAEIATELVWHEGQEALFRAAVRIPGGGSATGWGSENAGDFRDYLEKAETKAIGRALAALGFGTQFCADHETGGSVAEEEPAPAGQLVYLQNVAGKVGLSDEDLEHRALQEFGVPVHGLSRRDASKLATLIRAEERGAVDSVSAAGTVRQLHPVPAAGHARAR